LNIILTSFDSGADLSPKNSKLDPKQITMTDTKLVLILMLLVSVNLIRTQDEIIFKYLVVGAGSLVLLWPLN
jgi:hypothetical protein